MKRQVVFRNTSGALADPTAVNANAKDPLGNSRVGTTVQQSLGIWDALFAADVAGLWFYRVEGEGNSVDAVVEGSFCVQESSVE